MALLLFITPSIQARVTPNDLYQENRTQFETNLSKISDPQKKQQVIKADQLIQTINQDICANFDQEINKMSAILEEEKRRQNINSTRVAYGSGNTPMDNAEYYLNYAEEAVAYQKIQDYTPQISGGHLSGGIQSSLNNLLSDLSVLQGKILKAKSEINNALNYYEK